MDDSDKKLVIEFAKRYLNLEIAKKQIGLDMKALKSEFAEQGLNCSRTLKALKKIMKDSKTTESEKSALEIIEDVLATDKGVTDSIADVQAKD